MATKKAVPITTQYFRGYNRIGIGVHTKDSAQNGLTTIIYVFFQLIMKRDPFLGLLKSRLNQDEKLKIISLTRSLNLKTNPTGG